MTPPKAKDGRETLQETGPELLARLGTDASKWAAEFRKTAIGLGYSDMDEGWLIGWFANAIMNQYDAAQAEIARLKENQERMICNSCGTITRDGECDCDISPETKGAKALENYADAMCAEARRLSQAAPLPVAEDVEKKEDQ